ncbi:hypothetical protein CEXT_607541 [Caerostris extrusa]|uniref:Uncharacterized protein n=1 Tax=Caerostris extrusa TaxID=172846 RepID=A0AAV4VQB0_CAEEX|nr:hypothetical protein CEXT_607541 [Caerostris extrusa]
MTNILFMTYFLPPIASWKTTYNSNSEMKKQDNTPQHQDENVKKIPKLRGNRNAIKGTADPRRMDGYQGIE